MASRVALVTGGSRGIGAGIARTLATAGHDVVLTYARDQAAAESVQRVIETAGRRALAVQMRVQDRESVRDAFAAARSAFGPVTIMVNNAATAQEKQFDTITDDDWNELLGVNLRGPFSCCQEALPDMRAAGWGRIVNIASIGGQWGGMNQVHYAASKAGLISLTMSMAKLYSREGITANAVAPGLVATDMSGAELETEAGKEKVRNIPVGRLGTIEEVAETVSFLVSDAAAYITGQTVNVNGGMYFG